MGSFIRVNNLIFALMNLNLTVRSKISEACIGSSVIWRRVTKPELIQ